MKQHEGRVYPPKVPLAKEDQLARKIAAVATDAVAGNEELDAKIVKTVLE